MAATKFKGKNLSFTIAATEYNMDITTVTFENEAADDDVQTFADLSAGGSVNWTCTVEGVSDYGSTSLWSYLWSNPGVEAAFVFKPYGNATATTSQPHFAGTLIVRAKPSFGGTAGETFTYEYTFDVKNGAITKTP